jgi:hypothetical protein
MTFTNDELFLALVSLVRAARPAMLRQDADGFSIDFEAIAASKSPRDSDSLLLKLGAAMQGPPPAEAPSAGSEVAAAGAPSQAKPPTGGRSGRTEEEGTGTPETETEAAAADGSVSLDIGATEARQIAAALAKLEQLQAWPADVLAMSRALRARLAPAGGQ